MMHIKRKYGGFTAFLLIAALAACTNTALDEPSGGNGNGGGGGGGGSGGGGNVIKAEGFLLDAVAGLSVGDAEGGHRVATLAVPELGGPWTVELVEAVDHNHHFAVRLLEEEEEDEEEGEETGAVVMYEVVIAEGVTLGWGPYQISIRIYNEAGKEVFRTIQFEVSETPAPFKRAPSVYPYIVTPGKNKLEVLWEHVSGAEGYHIYVGETSTKPATAAKGIESGITLKTDITDIDGDEADGYLPDSVTYYVWVEAYNGSGGSLSSSAKRMTSATVQEYWYDGVEIHDCLYGDWYKFTQTTIEYGPMGLEYTGQILYHSAWTPEDAAGWPMATTGKHGEQYSNRPQGVFVIKYNPESNAARAANSSKPVAERTKLYSAVYYWGMDIDAYTTSGHTDKRQAYAVNQWNGYAERTSFEAAIDYFTCANVKLFLKAAAEPYIRFMSDE
jgi:hypothetical protein